MCSIAWSITPWKICEQEFWPEINALRRNHDDIVGAMSHDLDFFKRVFVQAGFIRSSNASGLMGLLGVSASEKSGQLLESLLTQISGNAAAEVSQVCWNANERGVYGRCRQQNSAQLWYVGGAGKAICCFSHDFSDDIFTDNWLYIESRNSTCVEKTTRICGSYTFYWTIGVGIVAIYSNWNNIHQWRESTE